MTSVVPVLLSGGSGSRLWPLSREAYPKQLLPLASDETLLQQTARRTADPQRFAPLLVVANAEHRFVVAEQLRAIGVPIGRIVLEPAGRNTAPAAAVGAIIATKTDPDAVLLLMPADHVVGDVSGFHAAIDEGVMAVQTGALVLFGIKPTAPVTGYGYIRMGEPLSPGLTARRAIAFVEKPHEQTAEAYLASGDYAWNSGIFLLPAKALIEEFARHAPDVLKACREAVADAKDDLDFMRLDPAAFCRAPSISIDYAIMERTTNAAVVPVDIHWTDVGAWSALWEIGAKGADGTVVVGDVVTEDASGCYIRSEGQLIAALGVDNLVIVATPDAVLVTSKERAQDVKKIVDRLKANGHAVATQTHRVHRPWGYYESIHRGDRFQVKRITVNPGARLSLQKHYHRAEHWVVVNGTALVTRDNEQILLRENESTFLPLGCVHRLENPGRVALNLIEVQSGPYLGEDDIVRFEDVYARI